MVGNEERMKERLKLTFKEIVLPLLAALLYAVNMKSFVSAGDLLPGGLSGLSVLFPDRSAYLQSSQRTSFWR